MEFGCGMGGNISRLYNAEENLKKWVENILSELEVKPDTNIEDWKEKLAPLLRAYGEKMVELETKYEDDSSESANRAFIECLDVLQPIWDFIQSLLEQERLKVIEEVREIFRKDIFSEEGTTIATARMAHINTLLSKLK